jgi:hypothetical protein
MVEFYQEIITCNTFEQYCNVIDKIHKIIVKKDDNYFK